MSKSGYTATLKVGAYAGANLTNVTLNINHETVDLSDLNSHFKERGGGVLDWEVTAQKNLTTAVFLNMARNGETSVAVSIIGPNGGLAVFSGVGLITRGMAAYPMAAANEDITIVGNGTVPVIRSTV